MCIRDSFEAAVRAALVEVGASEEAADKAVAYAAKNALGDTDRTTFQAMDCLLYTSAGRRERACIGRRGGTGRTQELGSGRTQLHGRPYQHIGAVRCV